MRRATGWAAVAAALTVAMALGGCSGSGADAGSDGAGSPTSTTPSSSSPSGPSTTTPPQVITADPEFAALEAQYGARLGVFIVDTATGTELSWRADERFAYASTHKALTAGALLDQVGIAGLGESVAIDAGVPVGHSPVTELRVGASMTLGELAAAAVEQSDNGAANLLFERLGGPAAFGAILQDLGDDVTSVARTELELNEAVPGDVRDTSSPRAFARDLQLYALGSVSGAEGGVPLDGAVDAPLDAAERDMLIGWMSNSTTGDTLIRAGAPEGWTVADKSGAGGYGTRNNIAVLWRPAGSANTAPFVMAVMSSRDSADADYNDQLISDAAAAAIAAITASE
jgi:beta-lactamase class A